MTAEERAHALGMEWALPDELEDEIALAITEAEDEALDRAALRLEHSAVCACQLCPQTVRSLKSRGGK